MTGARLPRIVATALVVLLVGAGLALLLRPRPVTTIAADFVHADGLLPGHDVAVLGVPVGVVTVVEARGATVRVTMELPTDRPIPEAAQAWIVNPSMVDDKYVELGPAYVDGPTLPDHAVIPPERTHAPITWDTLVASLNTVIAEFGPHGEAGRAGLGAALDSGASVLDGNGAAFRDAVRNIAQASDLVAGHSDDITGLLTNLGALVRLLADNRSTIDSLTTSTAAATDLLATQRGAISDTLGQLADTLGRVGELVDEHGEPLAADVGRLNDVTLAVLKQQRAFAELLDTGPLGLQNWNRAITPEDGLRVRLDVATDLSELPATRDLCERLPLPFCRGAGLTNPIPFSTGATDLLLGGTR